MSAFPMHRLNLALRVLVCSLSAGLFVMRYDVPPAIAVLASIGLASLADWFVDVSDVPTTVQEAWRNRIRGALAEVQFKLNWRLCHWEWCVWCRIDGQTRRTAFGPFKLTMSWGDPNDLAGYHAQRDEHISTYLVDGPIAGLRWSTVQLTFYRGLPTYHRGTADLWYRINRRGLRVRSAWWRGIEVAVHAQ